MDRNYWCIRLAGGEYAEPAKNGGYAAIGWRDLGDLTWLTEERSEEEALEKLKREYRKTYTEHSEVAVGLNCGQLIAFVLKIRNGDVVLSPANGYVMIGEVDSDYYYKYPAEDRCEYYNRRKVKWKVDVDRVDLPERLKSSLFAWQTVFSLNKHKHVLDGLLGYETPIVEKVVVGERVNDIIRQRFADLSPEFFQEQLIPSLLRAMGFEAEASPTYSSDGGIDVSGTFRMGVFTGDVRVQVKRTSSTISANQIRELRGSIKHGQQGVFITTSSFSNSATDEARNPQRLGGRIFLVDGEKLSDLILSMYDDLEEIIKEELESILGLRRTFAIFQILS